MSDGKKTRAFARVVAEDLSLDEINRVSGGDGEPNTGGCYRTLTGATQSRDGVVTYSDTDSCPSGGHYFVDTVSE